MNKVRTMEEMPISGFHYKIFAYAGGSTFIDGYVIGIIAVALSVMQTQMHMSATMWGLIGAATIGAMLLGGIIGGYLTDRIGRKKMFVIDMLVILVASILQFFVTEPLQLLILRFIIGIGIGADYPIAGAMMAEFAPQKNRGALLGGLNAGWFIGYAVSFVTGYFLLAVGDASWRWMLASSGVPVLIMLIARLNMPESPRWLAIKGRKQEANAIVKKIFGDNVVVSDEQEETVKASFFDIFRNGYGKWVFFVGAFWSFMLMPTFGIGTYTPEILARFGFADGKSEYLGAAIINILYLAGLVPSLWLIEKVGRRPTIIVPFLVSSIALFTLGVYADSNMSFTFILTLFVIYGVFNNAMGAHPWIYPNELFPTHIRATAMGFITGLTRVTSSIATFLFPMIMTKYGLAVPLYICGALFFLGFLLSLFMAPETKNMTLAETSSLNKQGNTLRT